MPAPAPDRAGVRQRAATATAATATAATATAFAGSCAGAASRAALAVGLMLALTPAAAAARDSLDGADPGAELRQTRGELDAARDKARELERQRAEAEGEIARLNESLAGAAARAQTAEQRVIDALGRMDLINQQLDARRRDLFARSRTLGAVLTALTRVGRAPAPVMIVRPDDAVAALRSALALKVVTPHLRAEADALRDAIGDLEERIAALEIEQAEASAARDSVAAEQAQIEALLEQRTQAAAVFAQDMAREERRIADLARRADSLSTLITALEADRKARERRKRLAERQRALTDAATPAPPDLGVADGGPARGAGGGGLGGGGLGGGGLGVDDADDDGARVTAAITAPASARAWRGDAPLQLPARGVLVTQFGDHDEVGDPISGVRLRTLKRAEVVAPVAGMVSFAGRWAGYGQLLIITPSDGYHVLLAGLEKIYAPVGRRIGAGEPVGRMGANGDGPPYLYVEVRHDGAPVNPAPWLSSNQWKASG